MLIESQNNVENRNAELLEILGGNIFIRNVLYAVALGKPASDYYLHKIYQAITATCFIMSLSLSVLSNFFLYQRSTMQIICGSSDLRQTLFVVAVSLLFDEKIN